MSDTKRIKRALVSVYHKEGLNEIISKLHEETLRGTLGELLRHFSEEEPRGEFVIVVGGKPAPPKEKRSKYSDINSQNEEEI